MEPNTNNKTAEPLAEQGMESNMENKNTEVKITNINMPFWSMVGFMIKWAIAAIPAIIVLAVIGTVLSAFLGGLLGVGAYNSFGF